MVLLDKAIPDVAQRFIQDEPLCFMTRAILGHVLSPEIDAVFEECRSRQYESRLKFSALAFAIGDVVLGFCKNFHKAFRRHQKVLGVSAASFYDKVNHVEPATAEGVVDFGVRRSRELLKEIGAGRWEVLKGYKCSVIDGNHLQKTEKRIKELRGLQAAALPGTVVAKYNLNEEVFDRAYLLPDAHAQESSVLDRVIADLEAKELLLGDRHFCIVKFMLDVAGRDSCFLIRHHKRLKYGLIGERREVGRIDVGMVYEQQMRIRNGDRELVLRRITLLLDEPTRDGDLEIHLLCNVPPQDADARVLAELYHQRWEIENAFYILTMTFTCEIKAVGHPQAALFFFCMALLAFNCRQVLYAALWTAHEAEEVERMSNEHVATAITEPMKGMLTAIPQTMWDDIVPPTSSGCAALLCAVAQYVDVRSFRKSTRGPKKPKPINRHKSSTHVSTHRVLMERKQRP